MNSKRTNYVMPDNHIIITPYYLLGYIEGDGSFYYNKSDQTTRLSLVTINEDRYLLEKIKEFFINMLNGNSLIFAKNKKFIFINDRKSKNNRKFVSTLEISQIDFICKYLIPFFDSLEFQSKKFLDYLDFKRISILLLDGKHLSEKGKDVINQLGNSMNNNRLSTKLRKAFINNKDMEQNLKLLEMSKPLLIKDKEGRIFMESTNKKIRSTYIIEAVLPNRVVAFYPNAVSCAKIFSVSISTIIRRLNDKKPLLDKKRKILLLSLKRIDAYNEK